MFTCERCGHASTTKANLISHLSRIHPCEPLVSDIECLALIKKLRDPPPGKKTYLCRKCNKCFLSRQGRCHHERQCEAEPTIVVDAHVYQEMMSRIATLEEQVASTQRAVTKKTNIQHQTNQTIHNQNVQNIQTQNVININAFGNENIEHLLNHPRFDVFMVRCIRDKVEGVCAYLEKKHLDPKHPENGNLRKLNKKDDFMETYDGRRWKIRFVETVLDELFRDLQTDFANFIDENVGTDLLKKQWVDNFMSQVGLPLDWDLSNDNYEFSGTMEDEEKKKAKERIKKMVIEYVHRRTKDMMVAQGNEGLTTS